MANKTVNVNDIPADPLHAPMGEITIWGADVIPVPELPNRLTRPGADLPPVVIPVLPPAGPVTPVAVHSGASAAVAPAAASTSITPGKDLVEAVAEANAETYPQPSEGGFYLLNSIGHGISRAWGTALGKTAILAGIGALAWTLFQHFSSSESTAPIDLSSQLSSTQAATARAQVSKQLDQTAKALTNAGFDAQSVTQNKTIAQLNADTAVQMATPKDLTVVANMPSAQRPMVMVGAQTPDHYVAVTDLNVDQYTSSLSKSPTLADLDRNSAVVHGMQTQQ